MLWLSSCSSFGHHHLSPLNPLPPPLLPPQSPPCCLWQWVLPLFFFLFWFNPSTIILQPTLPWQRSASVYESASILLVTSVCSWGSTYEWDHMVFVISDLLSSFSLMFSRSTHAIKKVKCSLWWPSSILLCKCTNAVLATHLPMDTWAASKAWVIVNNTAMNLGVHICFQMSVLGSFGEIPSSGNAGS